MKRALAVMACRVKRLASSTYVRNILTTGYGVAFAQAIPLLLAPLLTRIYSAEEFGIYAYYASITAILMVLSTARYEVAILMPKKDSDALSLAILATGLSFVICFLLAVILFVYGCVFMDQSIGSSRYWFWTFVALPGTALQVTSRVLFMWANRNKSYRLMARSRILQALTTVLISVLLGLYGLTESGLIAGLLLGAASGGIILVPSALKAFSTERSWIDSGSVLRVAKQFGRFPRYTLIGDTINILSWRLPLLSFAVLFGASAAGYLAIAYRVVGLPSVVAGTAFLGVFRQAAAQQLRENGECLDLYKRTFKYLVIIGLFTFIPLILFGPELFALIFGSDWGTSGEYVQILSFLFLFGFVASPLGSLLHVGNRQNWDMYWQLGFLLNTLFALGLGRMTGNLFDTITIMSVGSAVLYLVYVHLSRKVASNSPQMMN